MSKERLTYVDENGEVLFHAEDFPEDEGLTITQLAEDGRYKALEEIAGRLANREQYCELLEKELKHYRDLEEQGLLLRLPCKINQDIYFVPSETNFKLNILNNMSENNRVYHQRICHIVYDGNGYYLECDKELEYGTGRVFIDRHYGEIWFLSKSEAEEKLRELEGK